MNAFVDRTRISFAALVALAAKLFVQLQKRHIGEAEVK